MRARVFITPKQGVLDPQGKAVEHSLHALGFAEAPTCASASTSSCRSTASTAQQAERRTDEMCRKLLANGVIEDYRFELDE